MFRFKNKLAAVLAGAALVTISTVQAGGKNVPVEDRGAAQPEQRLENVERSLQNQGLLDMYHQIRSLQNEVNSLRGQLEVNTNELKQLRARQRDLYNDLDSRLQGLRDARTSDSDDTGEPPLEVVVPGDDFETTGEEADSSLTIENIDNNANADQVATAEEPPLTTPSTEEAAAGPDPLKAQAEYQQAFGLLKEAKYDQATQAFGTFVSNYPDSQYADNAQYWMAEAFYVQRKFETAITEYMKLVSNYPESQKAPNSMLKIGYSFYEVGKEEDARQALENLIERFPDTAAARDAKNRLQREAE